MIRERLERYKYIREEMEQIQQRLAELETAMYNPKIQRLSDMPSAPAKGNALEDMTIKHIQLQELYKAKLDELLGEQMFVEDIIATLEPKARLVFRYRYIAGMKWLDICDAMGYSRSYLDELHREAIMVLESRS